MHNTMDDVADRHMQAKEAMTELQKADRHMHNTSRNFFPKEKIAVVVRDWREGVPEDGAWRGWLGHGAGDAGARFP